MYQAVIATLLIADFVNMDSSGNPSLRMETLPVLLCVMAI